MASMCKAMSLYKMVRLLCRAAPVDWRNEQNYTLRRTASGLATFFLLSKLIYSLVTEHIDFDNMRAFTVVNEAVAVVALGSNFLLFSLLRHRGALLEMLTFIAVTLTMVSTTIAMFHVPFEFRLSTLSRLFSLFCFCAMLIGFHPAYYCAFVFCATSTHLMVFHFIYHDQGLEKRPDGLYRELVGHMVIPLLSVASSFMINHVNLQLYLYQAQSQQESQALNKLLGLSCDFVLPLHAKGGSEICISEVKPEFKAYVGRVCEGDSIRCIMADDSFEDFNQHVEQLAPLQPLLLPVTLKSGSCPFAAEMLLVRCPVFDDSEKFLAGVRIQEEIAPPDAVAILPPGLDNMRPASQELRAGFLGILPEAEAYEDSELGRSEAAFTTKTGMIFNCSKPQEAWRNILRLGRKEHWLVPAQNLSVEPSQILGSGGFGLVCEGKYCGANVAVKVPRKSFDTGDGQQAASAVAMLISYLQELRLLRIARHPNIVIFYGAFLAPTRGEVALVFERMEGPTLDFFLLAGNVADSYKALMMLDITHALLYLHSLRPPIVHGDLKPGNIFVECREGKMITKLADFGLARRITVSAATMGGTLRWAAPELLTADRGPSTTADIYSLGQLMYFILTSRRPYSGLSQRECQLAIHRGHDPSEEWPSGAFYVLLKPVVDHCRRYYPTERPHAAEVADVLEKFTNSRQGTRLKSTEIWKEKTIFGPSKIPGSTTLDDSDEEEQEVEPDADTKLCQAFDRARMLVLHSLTT